MHVLLHILMASLLGDSSVRQILSEEICGLITGFFPSIGLPNRVSSV